MYSLASSNSVWISAILSSENGILNRSFVSSLLNSEHLDTALGNIGFTTEQRLSIYKILAGIIFLRKIKFDAIDESAHIVDSRESLINASELIGIDFNALEKALIMRCICVNLTTIE